MNIISKCLALSLLVAGCATAGGTGSLTADTARSRSMPIEGPAARSVVFGPGTIHAYSADGSARLFTADVISGTDQDCQHARAATTRLEADQVVTFKVPAGQVACVEASAAGMHELIWHQTVEAVAEPALLAKSN